MALKDAELRDEAELESILMKDPELVEPEFRFLRSQVKTRPYKRRLDLLGVDSDDILTIVELKIREDKEQLLQAIEYFDWILERGLSFFRDYFSDQHIENKIPRIILIAPEFDERTIKACKYISEDIQIALKRYLCFEVAGKKVIKTFDEAIPPRREIEQPPTTLEDHIKYIKDERVRDTFSETISLIAGLDEEDIRVDHHLSYRINFICISRGLKFAELYRKRKYFSLYWKQEHDWGGEREIKALDEAKKLVEEKVKKALDLVKEK